MQPGSSRKSAAAAAAAGQSHYHHQPHPPPHPPPGHLQPAAAGLDLPPPRPARRCAPSPAAPTRRRSVAAGRARSAAQGRRPATPSSAGVTTARAGEPGALGATTHTAEVRREEVRDFLKDKADGHQRRAKRREIAESTACGCPRRCRPAGCGAAARTARSRTSPTHARAAFLGARAHAVIPDACIVPAAADARAELLLDLGGDGDDAGAWDYNDATRKFEAVLFLKVPAGRRDVAASPRGSTTW